MPMNTSFTEIELLEDKSLKLIKLLEKLPSTYFDEGWYTPSVKIVKEILSISKTIR